MTAIATALPPSLASTRASSGDTTDVELVAAVRDGDDRAFERLYERYHRRIAAYIYGMVNDYGRAEDIAQDVFLSALRRMRETDREIAFKPWVYEIAKNACIDQFRRARRAEEVSIDAEEGLGAADYGRLVTTGPSPDAAVAQKQTLDHLCGAFGGLSETHHQILIMRELEGLSYREIGERLGMSRPSVESTLFRARRRLGEEYSELVSGERCLRVQALILGAVGLAPGTRDQRRIAAHVSHCQPCRRAAHAAGVRIDAPRRVIPAKVAAFLPFPAFLRRRGGGDTDVGGLAASPNIGAVGHWSAQVGAAMDPAMVSWVKAAAAAATIAIVGVGAGEGTERLAKGNASPGVAPVTRVVAPAAARAKLPSGTAGATRTPVNGGTAAITAGGATPTANRASSGGSTTTKNRTSAVSAVKVPPPAGAPALPGLAPAAPGGTQDPSALAETLTGGSQPTGSGRPEPIEAAKGELPVPQVPVVTPTAQEVQGVAPDAGQSAVGIVARP